MLWTYSINGHRDVVEAASIWDALTKVREFVPLTCTGKLEISIKEAEQLKCKECGK